MTAAAEPLVRAWIAQVYAVVGPACPPIVVTYDADIAANAETKYDAGAIRTKWRQGYPAQLSLPDPNAADLAQAGIDAEYTACHDFGHGIAYWLRSLGIDAETELYAFRGYAGTPADARAAADAQSAMAGNADAGWQYQPREQVAETLRAAIGGRWIRPERAFNEGKYLDPMDARTWLQGLVARATTPAPPPLPPEPTPPDAVAPPASIGISGRGCDIASHQGAVDFDVLRNEVAFVIAKSSEGTGYRDPTFMRNWSEAKRVGLIRGAYHFVRPDLGTNAQDEAAYFLSSIPVIDAGDILALDYEVQWDGDVVGWCLAFLDLCYQMTGIRPYIYLNLSLVRGYDWTPVIAAGYPLWLAYYDGVPNDAPATPWPMVAMKQYTSDGQLAGVPSPRVDLNTAFGGETDMTPDEFRAAWIATYKEVLLPTIDAMKEAYNPCVVYMRDNGLLDADQQRAIDEATARLDKLRDI